MILPLSKRKRGLEPRPEGWHYRNLEFPFEPPFFCLNKKGGRSAHLKSLAFTFAVFFLVSKRVFCPLERLPPCPSLPPSPFFLGFCVLFGTEKKRTCGKAAPKHLRRNPGFSSACTTPLLLSSLSVKEGDGWAGDASTPTFMEEVNAVDSVPTYEYNYPALP